MPAIFLYAELLLHIRQVAVLAVLPSAIDTTTHIGISADSKTLSLEHAGVRALVELPCPVLGIANRREEGSLSEISFRLQPSGAARMPSSGKNLTGDDNPWTAAQVGAHTSLACRGCKKILTRSIATWKDLPSGGWAEMMEMWHCHKPSARRASGDDSSSASGSTKDYDAFNLMGPTAGTALVDVSHFVVAGEDCLGIQVRSGSDLFEHAPPGTSVTSLLRYNAQVQKPQKEVAVKEIVLPTNSTENHLVCADCQQPVGVEDKAVAGSVRLYKWGVAIPSQEKRFSKFVSAFQRNRDYGWTVYSIQRIMAAQLLALIDEQAVYRFLLYSGDMEEARDALLLWVFTPDLIYSTSDDRVPHRSMKIFYRTIPDPATKSENSDSKVEELQLPAYVIRQLHLDLKKSTAILPPSARQHQQWTIGLLDRQ